MLVNANPIDDPAVTYNAGEYQSCIKQCEEILAIHENDANANFYKGASLVKLKKYNEAIPYLKSAKQNSYDPLLAVEVNLLRSYAGSNNKEELFNLFEALMTQNFALTYVLDEAEFQPFLKDEKFITIKKEVQKNANPCKHDPIFKKLDFWLGEWEVFVNATKVATSSITKSEGGCTLHEDYRTNAGFSGMSVNYIDVTDSLYTQIWIDKFNTKTIFKEHDSGPGFLVMLAKQKNNNLTKMGYHIDKTTGHVTQTIETSTDDGKTWNSSFTGIYKPSKN